MMTLPEYIAEIGDIKAAEQFGVKPRTAASWRRRERLPRPNKATVIIKAAGGLVTHKGIYGSPEDCAA